MSQAFQTRMGIAVEAADAAPAGFALGTSILTAEGQIPVEFLEPGDRVITRDTGMAKIAEVRVTVLENVRACHISASVLGHGRPGSDLTVAPGQQLLLRDWRAKALYGAGVAMVAADRLVDGTYITRDDHPTTLRVFELVFETPHILYAEGLEVASAPLRARQPS